jgi:hypothetical protein
MTFQIGKIILRNPLLRMGRLQMKRLSFRKSRKITITRNNKRSLTRRILNSLKI